MQLPMIIVLFGLILELVEFNETYKIKYYNSHPWRRPRWHPPLKRLKHYHPKRIPSQKYHYYKPEPDYHRYASHEDSVDTSGKPYVIVIQLPHKNEKRRHQRKHIIDSSRDDDYIDDADELKVYQLNN